MLTQATSVQTSSCQGSLKEIISLGAHVSQLSPLSLDTGGGGGGVRSVVVDKVVGAQQTQVDSQH